MEKRRERPKIGRARRGPDIFSSTFSRPVTLYVAFSKIDGGSKSERQQVRKP